MAIYEKIKDYIKVKNNKLIFTGDEMIGYIPLNYFEGTTQYAYFYKDYIKLLGIFNYSIFNNNKSITGLGTFKVPSMIESKPYKIEKKELKLLNGSDKQFYNLLYYRNGDVIINDINSPMDISNVELFFKLFISGKLPNTIPYDELQNLFLKNAKMNGFMYPISNQTLGILIHELMKSSDDLQKPYAHTNFNESKTGYKPINIKDCPKYISPYTAFTSENFNESMVLAIMNDKPLDAPLEKLLIDK